MKKLIEMVLGLGLVVGVMLLLFVVTDKTMDYSVRHDAEIGLREEGYSYVEVNKDYYGSYTVVYGYEGPFNTKIKVGKVNVEKLDNVIDDITNNLENVKNNIENLFKSE